MISNRRTADRLVHRDEYVNKLPTLAPWQRADERRVRTSDAREIRDLMMSPRRR